VFAARDRMDESSDTVRAARARLFAAGEAKAVRYGWAESDVAPVEPR
jgi:hypothetical protein